MGSQHRRRRCRRRLIMGKVHSRRWYHKLGTMCWKMWIKTSSQWFVVRRISNMLVLLFHPRRKSVPWAVRQWWLHWFQLDFHWNTPQMCKERVWHWVVSWWGLLSWNTTYVWTRWLCGSYWWSSYIIKCKLYVLIYYILTAPCCYFVFVFIPRLSISHNVFLPSLPLSFVNTTYT